VFTRPLKVEHGTGSVRRPKTGVPPTVLRNQAKLPRVRQTDRQTPGFYANMFYANTYTDSLQ